MVVRHRFAMLFYTDKLITLSSGKNESNSNENIEHECIIFSTLHN